VNPRAGAFKDNAAFKRGNGGEDVKHQLTARCRSVYVLGERTEMHATFVKVFYDGYQVVHAAGQPVELPRLAIANDLRRKAHRAHEEDRSILRQHRELILNYFRAQKLISSGVVEGLDNKAKVTMRKSYDLRTYRVLELVFYHSLRKLGNRSGLLTKVL
jgi:hypothetical protein